MTQSGKRLPRLLTLREASELLNCHPNTLRAWDKKGYLVAVRIGLRNDRQYRKEDVMKLLEKKKKHYVTLIGSFRKDQVELQDIYNRLSEQFTLLSPKSISFTSDEDGFVKTDEETKRSISEIENRHLDAIKQSDFIVLHAPNGYVGSSASLEVGFAYALGIPILADAMPQDVTIAALMTGVLGDFENEYPVSKAGEGINALQSYYRRVAKRRGWDEESARDTLLLLIEEIGELARAVRKDAGLKRDVGYDNVSISDKLADVQLYLVHLANTLNVELSEAVTKKEIKNAERYKRSEKG